MFDEITASSLVKVNFDGEIVQDTPYAINRAGFVIHSAVHQAREDLECVIHLHSKNAVAISATREGLLPLNQSVMISRSTVARHPYEGVATNEDERQRLVSDLGDKCVMILDNRGALYVGASIADALIRMGMLDIGPHLAMGLTLQPADTDRYAGRRRRSPTTWIST